MIDPNIIRMLSSNSTERRKRRHHDRQQRQAGDRLDHAGHAEHRRFEPAAAGDEHTERHRDEER